MFYTSLLPNSGAGRRDYTSSFKIRISVNILTFIVLCLLGLSLVGCTSDELHPNRFGLVTLKVFVADGAASRSIDMAALNADRLYYQVYAFDGDKVASTPIFTGNITAFTGGSNQAELSLQLVAGEKYQVVMIGGNNARFEDGTYSLSDSGKLNIDYSLMRPNDTSCDLFTGVITFNASAEASLDVVLKRPFSRIDIGTDDLNTLAVQQIGAGNIEAQLKIESGVSATYDLLKQEAVAGYDGGVSNAVELKPENLFKYGQEGYEGIVSTYLLVANPGEGGKSLVDAELSFRNVATDAEISTIPFSSIPVKANCLTNIYGSLITRPVTATISVSDDFVSSEDNELTTVVSTADDLLAAFARGGTIQIPANTTVTIPRSKVNELEGNYIAINKPTQLIIDGTLKFLNTGSQHAVLFNVTDRMQVTGNGQIDIKGCRDVFQVNEGPLTIDGPDVNLQELSYSSPSKYSHPRLVWVTSPNVSDLPDASSVPDVIVRNCKINYTVKAILVAKGKKVVMENVTFIRNTPKDKLESSTEGVIQIADATGALSVLEMRNVEATSAAAKEFVLKMGYCDTKVDIYDCILTSKGSSRIIGITAKPTQMTKYSEVNIHSGQYTVPQNIVAGSTKSDRIDNEIIHLYGGEYTNRLCNSPQENENDILAPAPGYEWTETGTTPYAWQVQPVSGKQVRRLPGKKERSFNNLLLLSDKTQKIDKACLEH